MAPVNATHAVGAGFGNRARATLTPENVINSTCWIWACWRQGRAGRERDSTASPNSRIPISQAPQRLGWVSPQGGSGRGGVCSVARTRAQQSRVGGWAGAAPTLLRGQQCYTESAGQDHNQGWEEFGVLQLNGSGLGNGCPSRDSGKISPHAFLTAAGFNESQNRLSLEAFIIQNEPMPQLTCQNGSNVGLNCG